VVPVGVVVVVVTVVVEVVVVVVGVVPTKIVPVIDGCRSQWNTYVPAAVKVHAALHPGAVGTLGIGGDCDVPLTVQALGSALLPKSALCMLAPEGYEKETVSPGEIVSV
jgi:hypothetical protein